MTDRSLKIYQGEDLSPVTDLTDLTIWETSEFGHRAYLGEATNSSAVIRDEDGEVGNEQNLPAGLEMISLAAGNTLEYVHGSNVLWRGRLATKDYTKGAVPAGRYREVSTYLEDVNVDLRGIVVHGWTRPAETDVARVQALVAAYLSGSPRRSTVVNGSNLVAAGSNTVALPAKTYNQSYVNDVLDEIARTANKTYWLQPRRTTSDTHTAELFYDGNDAVMETCPYKITDREDEVRSSPDHYFYPIFNVGPASTEEGQGLVSGVWLFYGESDYVHVSDATQANLYIHREVIVYDDEVTSATEATARANAILSYHKYEERTINVTIGPLTDDHVGSIRDGQTIQIKARPIAYADDQFYSGRISQFKLTTFAPGRYFAHLQIDRPWRLAPYGTGNKATTVAPKPPTQPTPGTPATAGTPVYQWHFASNLFDDDTGTVDWGTKATYHASGAYDGGPYASTGFSGSSAQLEVSENTLYSFNLHAARNDQPGSSIAILWKGSSGALRVDIIAAAADLSTSWKEFSAAFTSPAGASTASLQMRTGYPRTLKWTDVVMSSGGTDAVEGDPGDSDELNAPGSAGPDGELGTSNKYMPLDTALPAQLAGDTPFDNTATTQLDATDLQSAVDELTRRSWISTIDPAATDDADDGFVVGDQWTNATSGDQFVLTDATAGSAVWTQTGGGSALAVEDSDASVSDSAVTKLIFPDGTLSIASHVATITLPTGAAAASIGDGSTTSFAVDHSLGTTDIIVQLWDQSGTDPVEATADASSITATDDDTVTIVFGSAPSSDQYRVVVLSRGASTSGGGFTQEYIGVTTVGASDLTPTNRRQYAVQVTLTEGRILQSVDVHVKGNASNVNNLVGAVMTDSSGTPGNVIASGGGNRANTLFLNTSYRWLSLPMGIYLTAGTYWLVAGSIYATSPAFRFAYDASSGSGKYNTATGDWFTENGSWTSHTDKISIRGNTIR